MLVRLVGPQRYTAAGVGASDPEASLNHYVVRLRLPARLKPGSYGVAVSRDGTGWVAIAGQRLEIRPDRDVPRSFSISDPQYGGCHPDDGQDDTSCIVRAISAARRAGGGEIVFGAGVWDLRQAGPEGVATPTGIEVPPGVDLRGAGSELTRLRRHPGWNDHAAAAFTLLRDSRVSGFTFQDLQAYRPADVAGPYLQLGADFQQLASSNAPVDAAVVDGVVITQNVFDKTFTAIGSGGLPISHLFVTHNTFGAYGGAIELPGNRFNLRYPFRIDDAVIDDNVFEPGSKLDLPNKSGPIASGCCERLYILGAERGT